MRIPPGSTVSFDLQVTPNDPNAQFRLTFPATPFTLDGTATGNPVFSITDSRPYTAVFAGVFHYKVHVDTADGPFEISHCPELEVNPDV
jgi:hypothetical protein